MMLRQLFMLSLFSLLLFVFIGLIFFLFQVEISLLDTGITVAGYWLIGISSLTIFQIGQKKEEDVQPMFSLASIGLNFFLTAILAIIYFKVLKKSGALYIILFFMLYLAFTLYLLRAIIKRLKTRSLKTV